MSVDLNDEIMQDFLVEAGEILELLNEQLVDLEQSPEDNDLLNSVFRGFHTIKGGAGFLSLTSLVEICHKSEDIFDLLRNGKLALSAQMMDVFLQVLDEVDRMFAQIHEAVDPDPAPAELDQMLLDMQSPTTEVEATGAATAPTKVNETVLDAVSAATPAEQENNTEVLLEAAEMESTDSMAEDISDEEFGALLETLNQSKSEPKVDNVGQTKPQSITNDASDEITDEEFEAMLDVLHGKDKGPATGPSSQVPIESDNKRDHTDKNLISDAEFDDVLDQIHGKGKGPGSTDNAESVSAAKPGPTASGSGTDKKVAVAPKPATPGSATPDSAKPVKTETSVRVDTARLDQIMNLVGELVLARNRLNTLKEGFTDVRVHQAISNLDSVTGDLQSAVMKTRMQPIKKVFGRFPRVIRDLARSLNKEVNLMMEGEDTDLDKNLVEALADPLIHLVRNSVDHGVELPAQRVAAGKPGAGNVVLAARQEGDNIHLSISDDGAGMDPEVLRNKVVEKGLMDHETASRLDDKGCFDLIFLPGLSTKQAISDVSGRGVGLDVVKTTITQLNGTVEIDSVIGKGTTLNIKVPLTLAILPTLMVKLGNRKYALPLSNVGEIFELNSKQVSVIDGREVILNRGKAPPLFHLRKWLLNGSEETEPRAQEPQVIMVRVASNLVGLVVDQVIGQEEVMIKPLGSMLQGLPGLAGSTITGDGNIAIILDVPGLLQCHA